MKVFGPDRKKSLDTDKPSTLRRKLLMGCAYLPAAPLLAMLGGCDDSGNSLTDASTTFETAPETVAEAAIPPLKIDLPPFKTTDQVVTPAPLVDPATTVDVTHVPKQQPLAKTTKMNVGIYSLQYNSFTQVSTRKTVKSKTPGAVGFTVTDPKDETKTKIIYYEAIETYLKRALDNRLALVYRAMVTAFAKHSPKEFDVSFFTAPEFYWNVPFGDFLTEVEVQMAANLCLETVTRNVRTLISKFPAEKYGKIVMLPGTIAVLKPNPEARTPSGALAGTKGIVYDASNHLTCTHNLPLNDPEYPRPAYMIWPKRVVSSIDYIDEAHNGDCSVGAALMKNPTNPGIDNFIKTCVLNTNNGLQVNIAYVSSSVAQSFDADGRLLSSKFQNDIVEGLPFGIDICLDYSEASVQKDEYRIAQLDDRDFALNFQVAAGMGLELENYTKTPFIQYAIYNEGLWGSTGATAAWKLIYTKGIGKRLGTMSYEELAPLDADSPDDKIEGIIAVDKTVNSVAPGDANSTGIPSAPTEPVVKGAISIDQTGAFVLPSDADSTGIPQILDKMNAGLVRIWSLDVDTSETASGSLRVASAQSPVRSEEVQFIE